jgi:probable O-glycosylation ligase (exosortase A-associated)
MLAAVAMALLLTWRSARRFRAAAGVLAIALAIVSVMPQSWFDRLHTIETYQEDASAMKRVNAWQFAWNFVSDNPVVGGGFEMFLSRDAYVKYAPRSDEGWIFQDAHSNYMKVLAEHGFPGLALFILLFVAAWFRAGKVIAWSRNYPDDSVQRRAGLLAGMLQTSLIAYGVGGAFLGLCYFDLPYNIVGLCIVLSTSVVKAHTVRVTGSNRQPASNSGIRSARAAATLSR